MVVQDQLPFRAGIAQHKRGTGAEILGSSSLGCVWAPTSSLESREGPVTPGWELLPVSEVNERGIKHIHMCYLWAASVRAANVAQK